MNLMGCWIGLLDLVGVEFLNGSGREKFLSIAF